MNNIGVIKLEEAGYEPAWIGVRLSYHVADNNEPLQTVAARLLAERGVTVDPDLLTRLSTKDRGHNKFLEAIDTWWMIRMPRDWWSQFDTFRHAMEGVDESVVQSESTMHTLLKRHVVPSDFAGHVPQPQIAYINQMIDAQNLREAKGNTPEYYLQTRCVKMNYQVLRNILLQRSTHKLEEWQILCDTIRQEVEHPELLP